MRLYTNKRGEMVMTLDVFKSLDFWAVWTSLHRKEPAS